MSELKRNKLESSFDLLTILNVGEYTHDSYAGHTVKSKWGYGLQFAIESANQNFSRNFGKIDTTRLDVSHYIYLRADGKFYLMVCLEEKKINN